MRLTPTEVQLIEGVGFDPAVIAAVREHTTNQLERLQRWTFKGPEDGPGLSIVVADGDEAEQLMIATRAVLQSAGYRAFWGNRHDANGLKESDEVVILKTTDPVTIIRFRGTDGANYSISTDDIIDRLTAWREICSFDIAGADHDWVALQFDRLPENICAFAEEVHRFCPDSVSQGVGLLREENEPQRFSDARVLCPKINYDMSAEHDRALQSMEEFAPDLAPEFKRQLMLLAKMSTPTDMGIRLLALEITRTKFLYLWWD